MEQRYIFFIAIIFAIYFAIFQLFIIFALFLQWERIKWELYMMTMYIGHLLLLIAFYIFGWNFIIHLTVQTIASVHAKIYDPSVYFSTFCQARFIFFSIMLCMLILYLIAGLIEIYSCIKCK